MMSEHQPMSYEYFATKQHKPKQKAQPRVYPLGVSSYLTGFLNGDHANDVDSGSESDDSFFSYSARLDMLQSTRNLDLSPAKSFTPAEHVLSPMSTIPKSPLFSTQSPQLRATKKLSHRKYGDAKKERKMSHPAKKYSNNARIRARNPSVSKSSFLSKPSSKVVPLHGNETESPYESMAKGIQAKPEMCDAEVQTTPVVFAEVEQKCPFCNQITFSPTMGGISSGRFSPIRDTPTTGKHTNFDSPSNQKEGQLSSPIKIKGPRPMSSSSSLKTSSFSSSDAMPEDLEHYVRASFSIPRESESPPKSSIDDPDGLRQGLSALLNGSSVKKISPPPVEKPKAIEPLDERPISPLSSPLSSPPSSGNLASISGVLFADPFVTDPSRNSSTLSPPKPSPLSRPRPQHRRTSSLRHSLTEAPPVPVIPDTYIHAQNRHLSGMPGQSSARPTSVHSSRPSTPPTAREPSLCYMGTVLAKEPPKWPGSSRQGSYKGKEIAYDVEVGNEYGLYDSSEDHFLPSRVTEIIHPHSPVQVVKPFPRRLSTRPELDEEDEDEEQVRRLQRNPSAVVANMDSQFQEYLETRFKMPTLVGNVSPAKSSRRSLGSGSTNRTSDLLIHRGSIRGSVSTNRSNEMPIHKGSISQPRPGERRSLGSGSIHRPPVVGNGSGSTTPPKVVGKPVGRVSPPKVEQKAPPSPQQRRRSSLWKKLISGPLPAEPDTKMPGTKSGPKKLQRKPSRNRK